MDDIYGLEITLRVEDGNLVVSLLGSTDTGLRYTISSDRVLLADIQDALARLALERT